MCTWHTGNQFQGSFHDGQIQGLGVFRFRAGGEYAGQVCHCWSYALCFCSGCRMCAGLGIRYCPSMCQAKRPKSWGTRKEWEGLDGNHGPHMACGQRAM